MMTTTRRNAEISNPIFVYMKIVRATPTTASAFRFNVVIASGNYAFHKPRDFSLVTINSVLTG